MKNHTGRSLGFLHINERNGKPRWTGVTEIRGPYYTPLGKRALLDILETMGAYVDIFKFSAGSFSLMPEDAVRDLIDTCHTHDVKVSTGGFIEHVLTMGPEAVERAASIAARSSSKSRMSLYLGEFARGCRSWPWTPGGASSPSTVSAFP